MLDEERRSQFIKYVNSILDGNKEIIAFEDTAKHMSKLFYELEVPVLEDVLSEEELYEISRAYNQIYQSVKSLLDEYINARESQEEMKRQKREAIRILEVIVSDLDSYIEKINQSISLKKEDKQIELAEEAIKKAKRANNIALTALAAAIIIPFVLFLIGWFCGNQ